MALAVRSRDRSNAERQRMGDNKDAQMLQNCTDYIDTGYRLGISPLDLWPRAFYFTGCWSGNFLSANI